MADVHNEEVGLTPDVQKPERIQMDIFAARFQTDGCRWKSASFPTGGIKVCHWPTRKPRSNAILVRVQSATNTPQYKADTWPFAGYRNIEL